MHYRCRQCCVVVEEFECEELETTEVLDEPHDRGTRALTYTYMICPFCRSDDLQEIDWEAHQLDLACERQARIDELMAKPTADLTMSELIERNSSPDWVEYLTKMAPPAPMVAKRVAA